MMTFSRLLPIPDCVGYRYCKPISPGPCQRRSMVRGYASVSIPNTLLAEIDELVGNGDPGHASRSELVREAPGTPVLEVGNRRRGDGGGSSRSPCGWRGTPISTASPPSPTASASNREATAPSPAARPAPAGRPAASTSPSRPASSGPAARPSASSASGRTPSRARRGQRPGGGSRCTGGRRQAEAIAARSSAGTSAAPCSPLQRAACPCP